MTNIVFRKVGADERQITNGDCMLYMFDLTLRGMYKVVIVEDTLKCNSTHVCDSLFLSPAYFANAYI